MAKTFHNWLKRGGGKQYELKCMFKFYLCVRLYILWQNKYTHSTEWASLSLLFASLLESSLSQYEISPPRAPPTPRGSPLARANNRYMPLARYKHVYMQNSLFKLTPFVFPVQKYTKFMRARPHCAFAYLLGNLSVGVHFPCTLCMYTRIWEIYWSVILFSLSAVMAFILLVVYH